jgi:hypothetical protein
MILSTHAIVGAAIASFLPSHPTAAFVLGFASHFVLDAIPLYCFSPRRMGYGQSYSAPSGPCCPIPSKLFTPHFPYEPLRTLQRFHRWIHTDKRIKEDIILGVGSQVAFVAVMVVLTMVAPYGVLDQALAK